MNLNLHQILCLLLPNVLLSQNISSVSGVVVDSSGTSLVNADVVLSNISDSTIQMKTVAEISEQYGFQKIFNLAIIKSITLILD